MQYSFGENNDTKDLEAGFPGNAARFAPSWIRQRTLSNIVRGRCAKTMGGYLRYSANGLALGGGYLRTELPGSTRSILGRWAGLTVPVLGIQFRAAAGTRLKLMPNCSCPVERAQSGGVLALLNAYGLVRPMVVSSR